MKPAELDAPTARALEVLGNMPVPEPAVHYMSAFRHIVATLHRQAQRIKEFEADARDGHGSNKDQAA